MELSCSGSDLAQIFEKHPLLPGAILLNQGQFVGMISRQRLLEFLIRPHGLELFLQKPLDVLHSYARCNLLLLPDRTPILLAAQQALRRSPDLLSEPIIVKSDRVHYLLDIHELNIAHWQIRGIETQVRYERTQAQLIQSDKMVNLGRLVDGVAHEILDPVSFIWGNLSHISTYSQGLLEILAAYEQAMPTPPAAVVQLQETLELDYLRHDLPKAIDSVKTGAERLSKLASSLQNFCHIDEVYPKPTNLHELLDSILLLLKSRLTSEIQVVKHYDRLPPVLCYPGQLNQVFINILTRSLERLLNQAVSKQLDQELKAKRNQHTVQSPMPHPTIEITTQLRSIPATDGAESRWVSICIADNAPGQSTKEQQQLLQSFSIKGRAAKETSLAVSYQIVTAKHGGKFWVRSRGTPLGDRELHPSNCLQENSVLEKLVQEKLVQKSSSPRGMEFEILLPLV